VLVSLRNDSSSTLRFVPSGSRYRILDVRGREVASGVFTYAIPESVAPGANAYLVETVSALFASAADVERVQVEPVTRPTDVAAPRLDVRGLTWRRTADGGLEASGIVSNDSAAAVETGFVCVLFFDANAELIGAVYDLTDVQDLAPGRSATFSTAYPGTPPLAPASVARAEGIAFSLQE
jgi:hypothetical protein